MNEPSINRLKWRLRIVVVLPVMIVLAALALILTSGSTPHKGAGHSTLKAVANGVTTIKSGAAPADGTECGQDFFDAASQTALENDYGLAPSPFVCFFDAYVNGWMVLVPGATAGDPLCTQASGTPSWCGSLAPSGAGIAMDRCATRDANCLSADGSHDLSSFTFYAAPDPNGPIGQPHGPNRTGFYPVVNDGSCGPMDFDMSNGEYVWPLSTEERDLVDGTTPPYAPDATTSFRMTTTVPLPSNDLKSSAPVVCPANPVAAATNTTTTPSTPTTTATTARALRLARLPLA